MTRPVAGHLEILRDFPSPAEGFVRCVRIYTPEAYEAGGDRRFPVLYMQDGQNVFEHPASAVYDTWRVNTALETLVASGALEPWIIVGVDSGPGRFEEYSPWPEPRANIQGRGQTYARFFLESLRPFMAHRYRVREDAASTAVAGSSLGGLISLYLGWAHPEHFGRVGAFSATLMWCQGQIQERWRTKPRGLSKIYLDAGEAEHVETAGLPLDYGRATQQFSDQLRGLGYGPAELKVVLEPGGQHHERDWQRRLPTALRWLLS
jgi:predicted alpha/beta superfamily hydrolase